ncbi:MAG TPA: hypothetical protein VLJ61_03375 [Pyrinomonadaceae bacterium]|nr:hypothetical protein [Pyrinomonadaceae bacterium]
MATNDLAFWTMLMTIIIAASFVVIAVTMVFIAVMLGRVARTVTNVERKVEPLVGRVGALAEQVGAIAVQGREVAEQVTVMSGHLSTATMHFSESMALIRDEVRDLKDIVGLSTETARAHVEKISRSIDETHEQLLTTTNYVTSKIVSPARELAAIMAGVRRGIEVLVAPSPKQINESYAEEEMFIG